MSRSAFGVIFSIGAWSMVLFVLVIQFIWFYAAFVTPHLVLADKLGRAAWTSPTTKYSSFMGFDYDQRLWQLAISKSLAEQLQMGCKDRAMLDDMESVLSDAVVESGSTKNSSAEQQHSTQSGCLIYQESDASRSSSIEIVLSARTLQIEVLNK